MTANPRMAASRISASHQFLGVWRWLIDENTIIAGSELAKAFSVQAKLARIGAPLEQFLHALHKEDKIRFARECARAAECGGELDIRVRLVDAVGGAQFVEAQGTCIRTEGGRPVEYMGAVHALEFDVNPLGLAADHLIEAAHLIRLTTETQACRLIDMALAEVGMRIAAMSRASFAA